MSLSDAPFRLFVLLTNKNVITVLPQTTFCKYVDSSCLAITPSISKLSRTLLGTVKHASKSYRRTAFSEIFAFDLFHSHLFRSCSSFSKRNRRDKIFGQLLALLSIYCKLFEIDVDTTILRYIIVIQYQNVTCMYSNTHMHNMHTKKQARNKNNEFPYSLLVNISKYCNSFSLHKGCSLVLSFA